MATCPTAFLLLIAALSTTATCLQPTAVLQAVQTQVVQAKNWAHNSARLKYGPESFISDEDGLNVALRDCAKLYEESEYRLTQMLSEETSYGRDDALTWLSAVMASHRTCLDGLEETGYVKAQDLGRNLTMLLRESLVMFRIKKGKEKVAAIARTVSKSNEGLLASWSLETSKADLTVAQDGSGTHKTIREAVAALGDSNEERVIIYVKSGVYDEKVEIGSKLKNVMFVGNGIDKTIVTGSRNVNQGTSTLDSASFDVSGDGFWARDMTFENTAGPEQHQAVALKVSSDVSIFYRCSFKGYQDTLYVHSNRQFYRDCHIYGTIDFIFGDAAVVFQNCDIFVRKPMDHQSNFITAQGRDDAGESTGISIHGCRVQPAWDFADVKGSFRTYLGRPWKEYSRTVFLKTDLDGFIDPKGWGEWSGDFAAKTLYYGEYMNTGSGASTENRVDWPGFHVLHSADEARPFSVGEFLAGERWIPAAGVPFSAEI